VQGDPAAARRRRARRRALPQHQPRASVAAGEAAGEAELVEETAVIGDERDGSPLQLRQHSGGVRVTERGLAQVDEERTSSFERLHLPTEIADDRDANLVDRGALVARYQVDKRRHGGGEEERYGDRTARKSPWSVAANRRGDGERGERSQRPQPSERVRCRTAERSDRHASGSDQPRAQQHRSGRDGPAADLVMSPSGGPPTTGQDCGEGRQGDDRRSERCRPVAEASHGPSVAPGSLTLVFPLYLEAHRFSRTADELLAFVNAQPAGSELIFVDDGSTDGTAELVERFIAAHTADPLQLLRRPHLGKGAAVRSGLEAASGEVAGFCDVDLSTPMDDVAVLVDAARQAPILAIASREVAGSELVHRQSRGRELLGRAYNRAVQLTLLPGIVDTQCGAKVARTDLWRRLLPSSREDRFAWDVEVIALAKGLGIGVQELPVGWRHDPGSGIRVGRDGARMLLAIPRIHRRVRQVTAGHTTPDPVRSVITTNGSMAPSIDQLGGSASGAFHGENAAALAAADIVHWWFRSKAAFVSSALRRFAPPPGWLVDVGAGSAGVTALVGWHLHGPSSRRAAPSSLPMRRADTHCGRSEPTSVPFRWPTGWPRSSACSM